MVKLGEEGSVQDERKFSPNELTELIHSTGVNGELRSDSLGGWKSTGYRQRRDAGDTDTAGWGI